MHPAHPSELADLIHSGSSRKLSAGRVSPLSTADTPAAAEEVEMAGVGPVVRPGSVEEHRALDRIAERRADERAALGDTFAARRKRSRRYWGAKGTT